MGIVYVKPLRTDRSGGLDKDRNRTYTRAWQVKTDHARVGSFAVRAAVGIKIGDTYENGEEGDPWYEADTGSYAVSIAETVISEDGMEWKVTVNYGPTEPLSENPLDDEPEVEWDFAQFERTADLAYDDDGALTVPVVNAAGDPFDPGVTRDDSRPVLTIVRNEADGAFDPLLAYRYRDATNADMFFGADPGTVKVASIKARRTKHPDIGYYWVVTYTFHLDEAGWTKKPLNQGMRQLNAAGDAYEPIIKKGCPVSEPVPLDLDGRELAPGSEPIFLEFRVYPIKPFSIFNFPGQ